LTHPLKRVGPRGAGQFEQISWDEALDIAHEGFSKAIAAHGPQCLSTMQVPMGNWRVVLWTGGFSIIWVQRC
jgi:anaerobic selenocysteine-containing dehydrogenase